MDSKSLIMILFALELNKKNDSGISQNDFSANKSIDLTFLSDFLKDLKVNSEYTREKIRIARKIGPYFPEKYINLVNKSILHSERIMKINELITFMTDDSSNYIKESITVENNKDRINKIIKTVQSEMQDGNDNNIGLVMDFLLNMDKYKTMFSVLSSVMNSSDPLGEPEKLMKLILPLLGEDEKDKEKVKEMSKMMEIMKMLNSPKDENKTLSPEKK